MKNIDKKNKYNISLKTLKDLRVAEKDYDKVYMIDFTNPYVSKINNVTTIVPVVKYVYSPNTFVNKHTIKPFTCKKQFFSNNGLPQKSRISSIYSRSQNQFRTVDIEKFIRTYKLCDKKSVNQ
jgi:hypothetical protein